MKKIVTTMMLLAFNAGFAMDQSNKNILDKGSETSAPKRLKAASQEELAAAAILASQLQQTPRTHNNFLTPQNDFFGINQTNEQNMYPCGPQPQGNHVYTNPTINNNPTARAAQAVLQPTPAHINIDDYISYDQTSDTDLNLEKWNILAIGKHKKNYQCQYDHPEWENCICGQEFLSASHARRHQKTHTGEKPYRCSICGSTGTQIDSIRKHIKNIHF